MAHLYFLACFPSMPLQKFLSDHLLCILQAQSAAGHKGADISNSRSTEAKQEAGRKAARTR